MSTNRMRSQIVAVIVGVALLAGTQGASAQGFLPLGEDQPPWILSNSDEDTSGQSDVVRYDDEGECIDWDAFFGLNARMTFRRVSYPMIRMARMMVDPAIQMAASLSKNASAVR